MSLRHKGKKEVRRVDCNEVLKHSFSRSVTNTSTIPIKNLDHLTMGGEGPPEEFLVLGPEDMDMDPLFLGFLLPLILKEERCDALEFHIDYREQSGWDYMYSLYTYLTLYEAFW